MSIVVLKSRLLHGGFKHTFTNSRFSLCGCVMHVFLLLEFYMCFVPNSGQGDQITLMKHLKSVCESTAEIFTLEE